MISKESLSIIKKKLKKTKKKTRHLFWDTFLRNTSLVTDEKLTCYTLMELCGQPLCNATD